MAAVHDKLFVAVIPPGVRVLKDGNSPGPRLVALGNPPVPLFMPDRIGKDVKYPLIAELLHHLGDGFPVQVVVPVMPRNRGLYGLLAGNVGLAGGPVLLRLPVLMGIASGIAVHRKLPLGLESVIGQVRDAVQHRVQAGAFLFCPLSVDSLHGGGYSQQRGGLGLGHIHQLRRRQNVLPDGILVCVVQNLLRRLAHQPVPVLGLLGGQFFIEPRVHFLLLHVQTLLPKSVSAWYNKQKYRG